MSSDVSVTLAHFTLSCHQQMEDCGVDQKIWRAYLQKREPVFFVKPFPRSRTKFHPVTRVSNRKAEPCQWRVRVRDSLLLTALQVNGFPLCYTEWCVHSVMAAAFVFTVSISITVCPHPVSCLSPIPSFPSCLPVLQKKERRYLYLCPVETLQMVKWLISCRPQCFTQQADTHTDLETDRPGEAAPVPFLTRLSQLIHQESTPRSWAWKKIGPIIIQIREAETSPKAKWWLKSHPLKSSWTWPSQNQHRDPNTWLAALIWPFYDLSSFRSSLGGHRSR